MRKDYTWDIETYPNAVTFTYLEHCTKEYTVFEISNRVNQLQEFLDFCRIAKKEHRWISFNGLGFDYPVVHWILEKAKKAKSEGRKLKLSPLQIYKYAMKVIESHKGEGFGIRVKSGDIIIPQIDLFKINHYDNKAKMTSLKLLEFNMRLENIEDLPFPVGKALTDDEIDVLIKYNKSDVNATYRFYELCKGAISFREELTEKYKFDCMNFNDTKIGEQFFVKKIESKDPNAFYCYDNNGRKKMKQTPREFINIGDCLFSYLQFKTPALKSLHKWFKSQVITETSGVFSNIEEHNLGDLSKYCEMTTKKVKFKTKPTPEDIELFKKDHPMGWVVEEELKAMEIVRDADGNIVKEEYIDEKGKTKLRSVKVPKKSYYGCYNVADTLNVIIGGFRVDCGVGGVHGALQGTFKSDDKRKIFSWDVASMYPNIAISNNVYPEHLGTTFCESYKELYFERKTYPKGSGENAALKLGLNGTYGKSNDKFSAFYDPKYTMTITINGQLTLLMLLERLVVDCDAKPISCNTDGIEVFIDNDKEQLAHNIVKRWEKYVNLEMEGVVYSALYMRDVNSYIGIYDDGSAKYKGAYEFLPMIQQDLSAMHKNHSAPIIAMAVAHEIVDGGDAISFIRNHDNPFDFMLRTKVPRSSRLVLEVDGEDIEQQNICRYYPSESGGKLVKIMPPLVEGGEERRLSIESSYKVKTCNNMKDFSWDINYDYYINEVKKLLEPFKTEVYKSTLHSG